MQSRCVHSSPRALQHSLPARAHRSRSALRCLASSQQQQRRTAVPHAAPSASPTSVPLSKQQQEAILPQPGAAENMASTPNTPDRLDVLENWADSYVMPDEMSLWDAEGDYYSSRRDLQLAYLPPKSDLPGLAAALSVIFCWVSAEGGVGAMTTQGGGVVCLTAQGHGRACAHGSRLACVAALCAAGQACPCAASRQLHLLLMWCNADSTTRSPPTLLLL